MTRDPQPRPSPEPREIDEWALRSAQRGDRDACRLLIERYQAPVHALLCRMLLPAGLEAAIDLGMVKSRLSRARAVLREALSEMDHG